MKLIKLTSFEIKYLLEELEGSLMKEGFYEPRLEQCIETENHFKAIRSVVNKLKE